MRISDWSSDVCSSDLPTDIDGMKAIHVLRWVYGVEHFRAVDLLGKRQLNQNAMYGRVGVELCYQREEFSLGAIRTVAMLERSHPDLARSEEHTSELQSLMRISYAVFCLKKKTKK